MDMPTTCSECLGVVEFSDMVDISASGAGNFVCSDCAEEYEKDCD